MRVRPRRTRRVAGLTTAALAVMTCGFGFAALPAQARKPPTAPSGASLQAPVDVQAVPADGAAWISWAMPGGDGYVTGRFRVTDLATGATRKVDLRYPDPRGGLFWPGLTDGVTYRFAVQSLSPYLGPSSAPVTVTPSRTVVVGAAAPDGVDSETGNDPPSLPLQVRLSSPAPQDLHVHVVTTQAGTATPGEDFVPLDTVVTVPAGQTVAPASIALLDDDVAEETETIGVHADVVESGMAVWGGGPDPVLVSVNDTDDTYLPYVRVEGGARVAEGDSGWTDVPFTVRLTKPLDHDTTVDAYAWSETYRSGSGWADMDTVPRLVEVPAGATKVPVVVRVRGDRSVEPDMTVKLNVVGKGEEFWATTPETATGTVVDDDGDTPQRGADLIVSAKTRGLLAGGPTLPGMLLRVRNHGDATATGVRLELKETDTRVAQAHLIAPGGPCQAETTINEDSVVSYVGIYPTRLHTCELGTLAPGQEVVVRLGGTVAQEGYWRWQAVVTSTDGTDPFHGDNTDGDTVYLPDPALPAPDGAGAEPSLPSDGTPSPRTSGPDTFRAAPAPPRDVTVTSGNRVARVCWLAPETDNNRPVVFYRVVDDVNGWIRRVSATATPDTPQCVGLRRDNGLPFSVSVAAVNYAGVSRSGVPSSVTPTRDDLTLGAATSAYESAGRPAVVTVPVTVTGTSRLWSSVRVRTTTAGTATPGTDFTPVDTELTIPPHDRSWTGQIAVQLKDDANVEPDETIGLQVSESDAVALLDPESGERVPTLDAVATILDDDDAPVVTVLNAPAITEGERGQTSLIYPVQLSKAPAEPLTLTYWGGAGSPDAAGAASAVSPRFDTRVRTVVVPAGERTAALSVPVFGDAAVDFDLHVPVRVLAPSGITVGGAVGWGTVLDDEDPAAVATAPAQDLRVRVLKASAADGQLRAQVRVRNDGPATSSAVAVRVVVAKAEGLSDVTVGPVGQGICRPLSDEAGSPWLMWQCTMPKLASGDNETLTVTGTLGGGASGGGTTVATSVRTDPFADPDLRNNTDTVTVR